MITVTIGRGGRAGREQIVSDALYSELEMYRRERGCEARFGVATDTLIVS